MRYVNFTPSYIRAKNQALNEKRNLTPQPKVALTVDQLIQRCRIPVAPDAGDDNQKFETFTLRERGIEIRPIPGAVCYFASKR